MEVRMMVEVLAPGMEDCGEADLGTEVLRIGGDGDQSLGGGFEQEAVDRRLVLIRDGSDRCRQREDDVKVGDREQLGFASGEPLRRSAPLAPGAVAVATRVVGDAGMGTVLATLDVPAERSRTASFYRVHDAKLASAYMPGIDFAPGRTVAAEDIRHLKP
jgi:hypothetical protein